MNSHANIGKSTQDNRFLANLYRGQLRWDLVSPFPEQSQEEKEIGDNAVREMIDFVGSTVDPELVDETRKLPERFISELDGRGYLKLCLDQTHGGLNLSQHNAFRVISAAMSWSVSAAYVIAIHHGLGIAGILPAIPRGPMRELILRSLSQGAISGWADTEITGAANNLPTTTATPVDGGRSYLLSGNKVFIGNGSVAREMIVTATIMSDAATEAGLFLVDTRSVGYRVESLHDVLGFRGLPLAAIALDDVLVPTERMLAGRDEHWRLAPLLEPISALGRMHVISGAALATGKLCLHWSRQFVNRRLVDGQPLGNFDQIQKVLSTTAAELFAIESVAHWCLIGDDTANLNDRHFDRVASKNINSMIGWRIVDRTLSLLAAEGLETASSKARRGAVPHPIERYFRDIRGLRVAGAVDFHVDQRAAESFLTQLYYSDASPSDNRQTVSRLQLPVSGLIERNQNHLRQTAQWTQEFAEFCQELVYHHPDPEDLFARQQLLILLSNVSNELFTMSLVLARAASTSDGQESGRQTLADIYCTAARHRVAGMWRQMGGLQDVDHAAVSDALLYGHGMDHLIQDARLSSPLEP